MRGSPAHTDGTLLPRLWRSLTLAALVVWCATFTTHADSATTNRQSLVQAGNEAFRAGHYRAALTKYHEAQLQGDRNSSLYFNLGVAHYWLEEYADAEREFRSAARDSKFTARSWYNLGLVTWARGDTHNARVWFDWVRRGASDSRLRSLAARALADLNRGISHPRYRRARASAPATGPFVMAGLRWGYDDNVYRTPDAPYVDLSQPGQPLVTPVPQSGSFAELNLLAQTTIESRSGTLYRLAYDFDGRFYLETPLQNADEQIHRLSFSADSVFGARGNRTLQTLAFVGSHQEINFDPDDGLDRVASGEDISDRFSYWNAVVSGDYTQSFGGIAVGVWGRAEMRDYGSVASVSEYDSNLYLLGTHVEFPIAPRSDLRVGYVYSIRDYSDRKAHDASGAIVVSNPLLEYRYQTLSATARFEFSRDASIRLGYALTHRDDTFAGYNDYTRQTLALDADWQISRRIGMALAATNRNYDYPNAFAFDVPQGGTKTLEYLDASLSVQLRLTRHLLVWGDVRYWDVASTDPRSQYSRLQIPIGVKWEQRF